MKSLLWRPHLWKEGFEQYVACGSFQPPDSEMLHWYPGGLSSGGFVYTIIQQNLSHTIQVPNCGPNAGGRKVRNKGPWTRWGHRAVGRQTCGRHEHMERLAVVECRKDLMEECLSLPGAVLVCTENVSREEGWGGVYQLGKKGWRLFILGKSVCVPDSVFCFFLFPFPKD